MPDLVGTTGTLLKMQVFRHLPWSFSSEGWGPRSLFLISFLGNFYWSGRFEEVWARRAFQILAFPVESTGATYVGRSHGLSSWKCTCCCPSLPSTLPCRAKMRPCLPPAFVSLQEGPGRGSRVPQEHSPARPFSQKDLGDSPKLLALQSEHPAPSSGGENPSSSREWGPLLQLRRPCLTDPSGPLASLPQL